MKKNMLYTGLIETLLGILLLIAAFVIDTRWGALLCGFGAGMLTPGLMALYRYYYWSRPARATLYKEKLEQDDIDLHDEFKTQLRDKSGRYAYILTILIIGLSSLVFAVIDIAGLYNANILLIYLLALMFFLLISGHVIYKHLLKKFE